MKLLSRILSVLLLGALLSACAEEISSEEHLANARRFLEEEKSAAAIVELKNALQKDANNSRARSLLGNTYFDRGEYPYAEKELTRAYSAGADAAVVVPILSQTLLSLGEYQQLEELKLDGLGPEGRSIAQAAKGLSMLHRGNLVSAAEILGVAMENEPRSPYAEVASARLAMAQQDYAEARRQLKLIFKTDPQYAPAWNLLGDVESAEKDPKKAHKAYTKALEITPRTFDARLNRVMMRIYLKNFKGARKDLEYLQKSAGYVNKIHPGVHFAWGIVQLQSKRINAARKSFEKAVEFSDSYPLSYYYMAAIDLENGGIQQAISSVYRFLGLLPNSIVGSKLAARLELEQKNYYKVEELLKGVVASDASDVEAMNLLASAMLAQGKSDEAVALLEKVSALRPESSQAKARLGAGYFAAGDEDLGVATLKNVLEADPKFEQADILIVLNYLRQGNVEEGIKAARGYRDRNPENSTAHTLLGRAYFIGGEKEQAKKAFQKSVELRPGDSGANHGLAEFALENKNYKQARAYYDRVLTENPGHVPTLMKVAASYAVEGKESEMFASLESAIAANPEAMEPRLVKARYFIARGRLDDAGPLLAQLTSEQKELPDALVTQAGYELAGNKYNQAFFTLEKLLKLRPDVSQYHYLKAKANAGLGDMNEFTAELERALELDPNHFYAKVALARLALVNNDQEDFEKRLADLKLVAPTNPDVMKMEVISAQKRGDNELATKVLDELVRQTPTTANVIALASHRQAVGNVDGAIKLLENWLGNHQDDLRVREQLAALYGATGQDGRVIELYSEILSGDENNVIALNNIAWYLLGRRSKEALKYAERAYALAPESSSVLDTLAMALMENNKLPEARRIIERALLLAPKNPDIGFHEAKLKAMEGDKKGAIAALTSILDRRAQFSERERAQSYLQLLQKP